MALVTLRPDSTVSNTATLVGGPTAHAVLSDNSDSSYISLAGNGSKVTLADLSLPAAAVIKTLLLRARTSATGAGAHVFDMTTGITGLSVDNYTVSWGTAGASTLALLDQAGLTDAQIDGAFIDVAGTNVLIHAVYLDVLYVTKPTLDVATPNVTDTAVPSIAWTSTLDSDGGGQYAYTVKLFTDAQYLAGGFDPATSASTQAREATSTETSWKPTALANDTYRAYVRVAQLVNGVLHWSDYDFTQFVINNSVTTPTLDATAANGRIVLTATQAMGAVADGTLKIERSYNEVDWVNFREVSIVNGSVKEYDLDTPGNVETYYRASARLNFGGGLFITSGFAFDHTKWLDLLYLRRYKVGDPGHPDSGLPEIINSRPISKPTLKASIAITNATQGGVVTLATSYGSYTWNEVSDSFPGGPQVTVPAVRYHPLGEQLTFTGSLVSPLAPAVIEEWYWDFGDGNFATGQVVTHTYKVANPGTICHLRVRDVDGNVAYASVNMMLAEFLPNFVHNPSFETGTTGYIATAAGPIGGSSTFAQTTAEFVEGTHAMRVTVGTTGVTRGACYGWGTSLNGAPALQGKPYTGFLRVRAVTGTLSMRFALEDNQLGNGLVVTSFVTVGQTWTPFSLTWTPTADSAIAMLYIYTAASAATGAQFDLDTVSVVPGTVARYFDGDSAGAYWMGTPHNSKSILLNP